jgi:hypothetical protein
MFAAFAATIVISIAAWAGLERAGFSSADIGSGPDVRLD